MREEVLTQIEDYVASNNLSSAIELLKKSKERQSALLLAARLEAINREITIGRLAISDVNQELNHLRSAILLLAGNLQLANENQSIIEHKQDDINHVNILYDQQRFSEATIEFKKILLNRPDDIDVLYKLGRCYLMLKSYDRALETFYLALKYNDKSGKVLNGLGVAYYHLGNFESAIFHYGQALLVEPTNQMFFSNKFNTLIQGKSFDELLQFCSFFIARYPQNPYYYYKRGTVYELHLRLFDQALNDYNKTLLLEPENPEFYYQRGCLYSRINQLDESIRDMDKAIDMSPDISYRKMKAAILHDCNRFESAISEYNKILKLEPNNAETYLNRSQAYTSLDFIDAALKDVNKSIEIESWKSRAYHQRAQIYSAKKKLENALDDINMAINLEPSNYFYKRYKSALLLDHNDYRSALLLLNEIVSSGNADSYSFLMRGVCYFENKKFNEAIKDFSFVLERTPEDCTAYGYLAKIYSILNNSILATEYKIKEDSCLKRNI